jgi:hypothetical protein
MITFRYSCRTFPAKLLGTVADHGPIVAESHS